MPIGTVLPPPEVVWEAKWYYPTMFNNNVVGTVPNATFEQLIYPGFLGPAVNLNIGPIGGVGGAGAVNVYDIHRNRPCARLSTTGANIGAAFFFPAWLAATGAASGYNSGAMLNPAGVVAVYDCHVAFSVATSDFPDDGTGFGFVPRTGAINIGNNVPRGSAPSGGFGFYAADDGAGNLQLQYLANGSGVGPVVRERVAAPAGSVPDVTDWFTVRFIIVSAGGGREPTLSVEVNGTAWVTDRQFGSAQLDDLPSLSTTALQWAFFHSVQGGAGARMFFSLGAKFGRFRPSGIEVQGV